MADEDIDLNYLCGHLWIIGSPATVTARLQELEIAWAASVRFLITSYDMQEERPSWERSLSLLTQEVLPLCRPGLLPGQTHGAEQ